MKYVIDIDGTLLDGSATLAGAVGFIARLEAGRCEYLLMTNSIKSAGQQADRLERAGLRIGPDRILTPVSAINAYARELCIRTAKVVGTDAEIAQIEARHSLVEYELVVLLDFQKSDFGYSALQGIVRDMEDGIPVVTASASPYYLSNGRRLIDTGSFANLLEGITGAKIENFGKPSSRYFSIAERKLGARKEDVCVVGDDWSTDIAGAKACGMRSVLVRSGKYRKNDESLCRPDLVVDSLDLLNPSC